MIQLQHLYNVAQLNPEVKMVKLGKSIQLAR